jgi:MFS family permease
MGLAAAALMPSTLSILTSVFTEDRERARAIGIWSATAGLGVAIGPMLGGGRLSRLTRGPADPGNSGWKVRIGCAGASLGASARPRTWRKG